MGLTGQSIDDERRAIVGAVDEQLFVGPMRLPHRHRKSRSPAAIEFSEPRIAITLGVASDVFVPHDHQCHMLALEFLAHCRPVDPAALTKPSVQSAKSPQRDSSIK
jgi:hypothetical protein